MAVAKQPAYQWYPKDYETDEAVKLMTYEEEGIYRRLLDHQWLHGAIPSDPDQIAKLLPKISRRRFMAIWPSLSPKFVPREDGRLVNPRLERQREAQCGYHEQQAANGRKGAEAKWTRARAGDPEEAAQLLMPEAVGAGPRPEDVVSLWNEIVTPPIPRVQRLTTGRRDKLRRRLREFPDLSVWRTVITWINQQDWCRALGSGEHANWTATLDWLIKSDDQMQRYIERATANSRKAETPIRVLGCRHLPPCRDAVSCTARRNAERMVIPS